MHFNFIETLKKKLNLFKNIEKMMCCIDIEYSLIQSPGVVLLTGAYSHDRIQALHICWASKNLMMANVNLLHIFCFFLHCSAFLDRPFLLVVLWLNADGNSFTWWKISVIHTPVTLEH